MEETESIDLTVGCLDGSEGILTEVGKKSLTFSKILFLNECKFYIS